MSAAGPNGTTITVEFSPTTAPLDTPIWVDITDDVLYSAGITINRGRAFELETIPTGTCSFVLKNTSRDYDPFFAAGPYFGDLLPLRRFRVVVTYDSVDHALFTGFCAGWPQEYDESDVLPIVPVLLVDGFELIAQAKLPGSVLEYEILQDSPHAYWPLDDPAGSYVARDVSGNGFDGVYRHPMELSDDDELVVGSRSRIFDGVQDAVDITDAGVRLSTDEANASSFSVEGWFRTTSTAAADEYDTIFQQGADASGDAVRLNVDDSRVVVFEWVHHGGGVNFVGVSLVNDGEAHHAYGEAVYPGSVGPYDVAVYVDGADDSGGTSAQGTNATRAVVIGGHPNRRNTRDYFNGALGHIAIYQADLADDRIAAHAAAGTAPWDGDTTDERIGNVLDVIGWPAGERDMETGSTTLGAARDLSGDPLSYLHRVEATEAGRLFIDPTGNVRFLSRAWLLTDTTATTSQATFGEDGTAGELPVKAGAIRIDQTRDHIRNVVTAHLDDGSAVTITDADSVAAYGERTHTVDSIAPTANQARNLAEYVADRYADVQARLPVLTVQAHKTPGASDTWTVDDLMAAVLELDIGHRVTAKRRPASGAAISVAALVEGVSHTIHLDRWDTDLRVSPADTQTYAMWGSGLWGTDVWGY